MKILALKHKLAWLGWSVTTAPGHSLNVLWVGHVRIHIEEQPGRFIITLGDLRRTVGVDHGGDIIGSAMAVSAAIRSLLTEAGHCQPARMADLEHQAALN